MKNGDFFFLTLLGHFIISVMLGSSEDCEGAICCCAGGGETATGGGGGISCSLSPTILPPRLLVFSTCKATDIPCSFLPSPCPSLKPYLAIIFAATDDVAYPMLVGGLGVGGGRSEDSCKEGGGAIAAPPAIPLDVGVLSSSLSGGIIVLFPEEV